MTAVQNLYTICGTNYQLPNLFDEYSAEVAAEADNEAKLIAQSLSTTFQEVYADFLIRIRTESIRECNGEIFSEKDALNEEDYEDVLNQQVSPENDLALFCNKESSRQIIVDKCVGESMGIALTETGWGSFVPSVLVASLASGSAAHRNGNINVGNQILSLNGQSLVGLSLVRTQQLFKQCHCKTSVSLTLVSSAPVVDVIINRPSPHYQMGFAVQDGVVCSLLRGGIAERGGLRVGHRIIELNGRSFVNVNHHTIVDTLAVSTGKLIMKIMPLAIYKCMTGQTKPYYL